MALKSKPTESVRASVPVNKVIEDEMVRVNLLVPSRVRKEWKLQAASRDTTITDMINTAMSQYLNTHRLN